jgi:hypothetical protein
MTANPAYTYEVTAGAPGTGPGSGGGTLSFPYKWRGTNTGTDPGSGYVAVSGSGNQPRVIAFSATTAAGVGVNPQLLHAGDTLVITDDPDTPPITGFARYVVTVAPVPMDGGTWWTVTAIRTDAVGPAQPPAVDTPLLMVAFLSDIQPFIPRTWADFPA